MDIARPRHASGRYARDYDGSVRNARRVSGRRWSFAPPVLLSGVILSGCTVERLGGALRPAGGSADAAVAAGADAGLPTDGGGGVPQPVGVPVEQIEVVDVEANQGVAVRVVRAGQTLAPDTRNQPLIRGRHMLVRGYWSLGANWQPRSVRGQLNVRYGDGRRRVFNDTKIVTAPSDARTLDGTFNWRLTGDDVQLGMEFNIELYEGDPPAGAAITPPSRLPASGDIKMVLADEASELKVVLIPADLQGSPPPSATPEEIENVRTWLLDMYPVQRVELEVRDPAPVPGGLDAGETAPFWAELRRICRLQATPVPGVFFHWIISRPESGISAGGVAAGSPPSRTDPCRTVSMTLVNYTATFRSGVGAGTTVVYRNSIDAKLTTISHEFGHNHDRRHIDCGGPARVDPTFPYQDGSLGVQGYRFSADELRNVGEWHDIMGYCRPRWISDWQYGRLYEATKRYTEWSNAARRSFEDGTYRPPPGRTMQGYLTRNRARGYWAEIPGTLVAPGAVPDADNYAQYWVGGRAGPRLPIRVTPDSEGDGFEVVFTAPEGGPYDAATVVVDGVRRAIDLRQLERF